MADKKRKKQPSMEAFLVRKTRKDPGNVKRLKRVLGDHKSVLNLQSMVLLSLNKIYPTSNQSHLNDSEIAEVANNNAGLTQKIASETHDCGPRQPRLHRFPVRDPKSKKTKSFQASWYNRLDWLEYSVAEDAAFCYPCRKFF